MPGAATRRSQASASSKPAGDGGAVECRDHRHRCLRDHLEDVAAGPVHRRPEALPALVGGADLLEVEARAEGRPVPGEDDRRDAVGRAGEELLDQVGLQRARQGVAALGPVEGEDAEVPAVLDDQSGLVADRGPHAPIMAHGQRAPRDRQ
jgi:hypothetical protein